MSRVSSFLMGVLPFLLVGCGVGAALHWGWGCAAVGLLAFADYWMDKWK